MARAQERRAVLVLAALALASPGCTRGDPPTPPGSPSSAPLEPGQPGPGLAEAPSARPSAVPSPAPLPEVRAQARADAGVPDADAASLPQTRDRPVASGPAFDARVAALWSAIVTDDPDRAMPMFFPLPAYMQVKDVTDPSADWRRRLVAAYRRDIHALHAELGDASDAALVALAVPDGRAAWVEPGEEWNKVGYYRVFGSKLRFRAGEQDRSFDVKSLISWRGEWFLVHLSAIR